MTKNDAQLEYKDTTFVGLLITDKFSSSKNWSIVWSLLMTAITTYFVYQQKHPDKLLESISHSLSNTLLGASAGIFGIVIAALTLVISLFHHNLLLSMLKEKILQKFLFPFWKAVLLWCISIVLSLYLMILEAIPLNFLINKIIIAELFIFLYATFYTVNLTGLVIRLALQRAMIKD
ncbi:hypothetical protein [Sporolactobacillus nakayamae]|uniref:Uncharacterized protein n=1 Tax=Sporolactobacillus nakayamae TaxID=269670 RepID=A0A1I2P657_9BACL|nr:hypothetical protein [Sporolactobacillus nakayamae]SFG09457.1 hypothetical protein SAMN02982927_00650 [Sporolactobacillus nakayamae]